MIKEQTASSTDQIDQAIATLGTKKDEWATLPVSRKVEMLSATRACLKQQAQAWVDAAVQGKRIDPQSPWVGEEWVSGPWAVAAGINSYMETLAELAQGKIRQPKKVDVHQSGHTVAHVFPNNFYSGLIMNGVTGEVWMERGVSPDQLVKNTAAFYKKKSPSGKVSLVLGAGNINAIAPLDTLHKLLADGEVVILKLNPVNDYLGPVLEKAFAPFVDAGYLRFAYGGAEVGHYLTEHEGIDTIHITGSGRTYEAIVFGGGEAGAARKAANDPVSTKPITSELGGVTPIIVVPGDWSDADIRFQAERIVTAKLHNAGCNCVGAQIIITDKNWNKREQLLAEIQRLMASLPPRQAYYPGAENRLQRALDNYPNASKSDGAAPRVMVTDLDADSGDVCFSNEYFTTVLGETALEAGDSAEFLQKAVQFANDKLDGTLGVSILIDPKTAKANRRELERAIADLRYGAIAVNLWSGVAFLLAECAWGGVAGQTNADIQSGIGFVHNAFLFDRVEKSVVRGSFYSFPRGYAHGDLAILPRPPWFVTNKTAHITGKRVAQFALDPSPRHLPGIFASALRGI